MESDTLGSTQNDPNRVLVVDDPFLSMVILSDKTNAIGLNRFLALLGLDVAKHLECIKQLARMNFGNYFTIDVYEHIKKKVLEEEDETIQKRLAEEVFKFFIGEFIDATGKPELWKYNNAVIHDIGLHKKLYLTNEEDGFDRILLKAIIHNFSKEHPEESKRRREGFIKRFRSRLVREGGQMYLETWLESKVEIGDGTPI